MPDKTYIGFDFGFARIGVAVGQQITKRASPLSTLKANQGIPDWHRVAKLVREWHPDGFIVGLPKHIDGREQFTTEASREFAEQLKQRFNLPVCMVDERLSTVEARAQLFEHGGYRNIRKSQVDSIAACIILEQWLQTGEL